MALLIELQVVMHYADEEWAPETFGYESLDHVPAVGEKVDLHWTDGRLAGHVVVREIVGTVLHVGDILKGPGRGAVAKKNGP